MAEAGCSCVFILFCALISISFDVGLTSSSSSSTKSLSSKPTRAPLATKPAHHRAHNTIRYRTGLLNHLENTRAAFSSNTPVAYPPSSSPKFASDKTTVSPPDAPERRKSSSARRGAPTSKRSSPTPIYIVILLPNNSTYMYSYKRVSPAVSMAVDAVTSSRILKGYQFEILYADSNCSIGTAMNEAIKIYMKGKLDIFFGPVCDYAVAPVARQAAYWKVPMITSGAMAGDFKMYRDTQYTTLTRVGTNYNALSDFMVAVLRYHSYHNVVMFYDGEGQTEVMYKLCHVVMNALHEQLKESVVHSSYKIYNHPIKYTSKEDFNDIFRYRIGTKYAGKYPRGVE